MAKTAKPPLLPVPAQDTVQDTTVFINGLALLRDTALGRRLGMAQPLNMRRALRNNMARLEACGALFSRTGRFIGGKGAVQRTKAFYLAPAQVTFLSGFARMAVPVLEISDLKAALLPSSQPKESAHMQYEPQSATEVSTVEFAGIEIDGQFLLRDVDLGAKMGLAQPLDIRRTIVRNMAWLEDHGSIRSVREVIIAGKGAEREVTVYHLNQGQALSLCLLMRTAKARALHASVVRFFLERRRREAVPKPRLAFPHPWPNPDPAAAVPLRLGLPALKVQLESLATLTGNVRAMTPRLMKSVTRLPLGSNAAVRAMPNAPDS